MFRAILCALCLLLTTISVYASKNLCLCAEDDVLVWKGPMAHSSVAGVLRKGRCIHNYKHNKDWINVDFDDKSGVVKDSGLLHIRDCSKHKEDLRKRTINCGDDVCHSGHCCYRHHHAHRNVEKQHHYHDQQLDCTHCPKLCCIDHTTTTAAPVIYSNWGECTVQCGGGHQFRHCVENCPTQHMTEESRECNTQPCVTTDEPHTNTWSQWGEWESCSHACGGGRHFRRRECLNSEHHPVGHHYCPGDHKMSESCNTHECPVNGGWSHFSHWSHCSATCGGGHQQRTRTCNNPLPQHGGAYCDGQEIEVSTCNSQHCPINGGWSHWGHWSHCSATCGESQQTRTRTCNHPVPRFGGENCHGMENDVSTCKKHDCPVNGGWSDWGHWSHCSATCGDSHRTRTRTCNNPKPQFGGAHCHGEENDIENCKTHTCPDAAVDGGWGSWSHWTDCSVSCGSGHRSRSRQCDSPAPRNGGRHCHGHSRDTHDCNAPQCPPVVVNGGWGQWSSWTGCSVSCGSGQRSRSRHCNSPVPQNGGSHCHGDHDETQVCNGPQCPPVAVNGGWGGWSSWTDCSVSCGSGQRSRSRQCDSPVPQNGGIQCHGYNNETQTCNAQSCPLNHSCDKLSVLHALAEIDTVSKKICLNNWITETEMFLVEHCRAPNDTSLWHKGLSVLQICQSNPTQLLYQPVGTFENDTYGLKTSAKFSGIFVGCNNNNTGFKIATRVCGGVAEVIEIPLPVNYNHTSTGIIPNVPASYNLILW